MKRKLLLLLSVTLLLLSSCGSGSRVRTEKEILEDIAANDYYFEYGLEVTSYKIEKRQTNEDDKTDYVWVTLTAESDYFTYEASYTLSYVLYNDGWLFENCNRTNYSYSPLIDVDMSRVDALLAEKYEAYSFDSVISEDIEYCTAIYLYTATKAVGYTMIDCYVVVECTFSPQNSWTPTVVNDEEEIAVHWNILGEWYYYSESGSGNLLTGDFIYFNIVSIDDETITFEYEIYKQSFGPGADHYEKSDGSITCTYKNDQYGYSGDYHSAWLPETKREDGSGSVLYSFGMDSRDGLKWQFGNYNLTLNHRN